MSADQFVIGCQRAERASSGLWYVVCPVRNNTVTMPHHSTVRCCRCQPAGGEDTSESPARFPKRAVHSDAGVAHA